MKKLLTLFLATVIALPVVTSSLVHAVTTDSTTTTTPTTTTSSTPTTTNTSHESMKQTVEDRIAEHKNAMKTKLNSAQKLHLKSKCKASQGKISSAGQRIKGIETSRTEVYKNITDRLTSISEKLKAKGTDTTELNADIAALKGKMDTFNTDLTKFKQIVSDLSAMDCETDPEGFGASLEAARTARQQVQTDGQAVRTYIDDTIKPLLKTIRTNLAKTEGQG